MKLHVNIAFTANQYTHVQLHISSSNIPAQVKVLPYVPHMHRKAANLIVSISVVRSVCISMTSVAFIVRLKPHEDKSSVIQFSHL